MLVPAPGEAGAGSQEDRKLPSPWFVQEKQWELFFTVHSRAHLPHGHCATVGVTFL